MGAKRVAATHVLKNTSVLTILFQQVLFFITYSFFQSVTIIPVSVHYRQYSRTYLERYFDAPVYFENEVEIMKCVLEIEKLFVLILIICIIRLLAIIFSSKRKRKQALVSFIITLAVIGIIILHSFFTQNLYYLYMRLLPGEALSLFCAYLLRL